MAVVNKGGRPRKEVNWQTVDSLCEIHCTGEEIAHVLGMHYDTLDARCRETYGLGFSDYYKRASSGGKKSLRRMQYDMAMKGNVPMLIWLGKNWLNQRDQIEPEAKDIPQLKVIVDNEAD